MATKQKQVLKVTDLETIAQNAGIVPGVPGTVKQSDKSLQRANRKPSKAKETQPEEQPKQPDELPTSIAEALTNQLLNLGQTCQAINNRLSMLEQGIAPEHSDIHGKGGSNRTSNGNRGNGGGNWRKSNKAKRKDLTDAQQDMLIDQYGDEQIELTIKGTIVRSPNGAKVFFRTEAVEDAIRLANGDIIVFGLGRDPSPIWCNPYNAGEDD